MSGTESTQTEKLLAIAAMDHAPFLRAAPFGSSRPLRDLGCSPKATTS